MNSTNLVLSPTDGVIRKLYYHIDILDKVREKLGAPIIISKQSGYRPVAYEKAQGRSGNSEHTFKGLGAVDVTCRQDKLQELLQLLLQSEYMRVCFYPNNHFIHCDFKGYKKTYYTCYDGITWVNHNTI